MALKEYIGLTRLTEVFGYLKTKLDDKVNKTDIVSKQAAGLVPQLPNETATTKYLRQDGSWEIPPNTYDRNRFQAAVKAGSTALGASNIIVGINGSYHQLNDGTAFDISYPILFLASACSADATTYNSYDIIHVTITTTQAITLTPYIPVFIKGTLSGTTFTPVSATPLTQTVPATEDGYQYIFLGNATGSVSLYLTEVHDIYEYRNGAFGPMVGSGSSTYTEGDGIDISAQNAISVDTTFTEASTRANIDSGDTFSTILGKIKKFFSDLKAVAFSGSYDDLSNKPTIPAAQVNSDWNASSGVAQILNKPSLSTVATSGSYNDLSNKPTIPTNTNQLTNGAGFITSSGSCNYANSAGSAAPTANSVNYVRVYNSNNVGQSGTVTVNDLAKQHFAAAMISAATDNPRGSSGWVHVLSQAWSNGSDAWCAQWAINVHDGVGAYYRASSGGGSIAGRGWYRIIDSNNIGSQSVNYANSAGNASKVGGYSVSSSATANTVALRQGDGYLYAVYYNASNGAENINSYSGALVMFKDTNGWQRCTSLANLKTFIGSLPASDVYSWAKASSKPSYAWSEITSKPTFSASATANTVAQRDGGAHLQMNNCVCSAVAVSSDNWLPICGSGAVTIRNRNNSAYIPAFASAFTVNSSRRYKENIVSMTEEDAKTLLSLRPVTFDYKEGIVDGDRTGQKGLIAEEVAEIETFPVVYNQDGEVEGLDYSKFVPQLIKLCQMQQKQIDDLTARLEELERNNQ